jgi:hypothetical protein
MPPAPPAPAGYAMPPAPGVPNQYAQVQSGFKTTPVDDGETYAL